jgi:hypothetical protein
MFKKAYGFEKDEFAYPLLVTICYRRAGREKDAADYLKSTIDAMPRESLFYQMGRYYLLPSSDALVFRYVTAEKDKTMRTRMLFYLAAQYLLQDKTSLAQKYLLEVGDLKVPGLIEPLLAAWDLRKFK